MSLSLDKESVVLATKDQGWRFLYEGRAKLSLDPSIFIEDDGRIKNTVQIVLSGSTYTPQTNILWGLKEFPNNIIPIYILQRIVLHQNPLSIFSYY